MKIELGDNEFIEMKHGSGFGLAVETNGDLAHVAIMTKTGDTVEIQVMDDGQYVIHEAGDTALAERVGD